MVDTGTRPLAFSDGREWLCSFPSPLSGCLEGGGEQVPGPGRLKVAPGQWRSHSGSAVVKETKAVKTGIGQTLAVFSGDSDTKTEGGRQRREKKSAVRE